MKKITITLFMLSMIVAISCQQSEIAQPKSKSKNARNSATSLAVTEVIPLNGSANGYTYYDIEIAFVNWILGPSFNDSPLSDPDGSRHVAGLQPLNGIMILGSNFGGESTRSVTIPADTYVYLPVFGYVFWKYSPADDPCDHSKMPVGHPLYNFLGARLKSFENNQKSQDLIAKVDGVDIVPDLTQYKVVSSPFYLIANNDFNNPACDYTGKIATAKNMGYGVLIKLSPGPHTIVFSGITNNNQFYSGVTWNVNVEE
ncbi:MAG: hypothetical protein V4683_16120 [Bacteroidota bacterium]